MFTDHDSAELRRVIGRDGWLVATRLVTETSSYLEAVKAFLERSGAPVAFDSRGMPNFYGWTDYLAVRHITEQGCGWALLPEATVRETEYNLFDGTFAPSMYETGLDATPATCFCGQYTRVTLRWVGGMQALLRMLL